MLGRSLVLQNIRCKFPQRFFHVCIVGSGPSAFYVAQSLLKNDKTHIDIIEKLPAPFGLVRYGVAPDHPEVKNVINTFNQVAKNPRFHYFGNITVGKDVSLKELRSAYDAVVMAYGASADRHMNIPGENLPGVVSAKDLVGWYNGYPNPSAPLPDLNCETAAIVGMGNVALDVARILLSSVDRLRKTDIPEPVINHLATSRIRRVVVIGRRGPLQAAFTLREFRELCKLRGTRTVPDGGISVEFTPPGVFNDTLFKGCERMKILSGLQRPRRRLIDFMIDRADHPPPPPPPMTADGSPVTCEMRFLRSPVRVVPRDPVSTDPSVSSVAGIDFQINKLVGPPSDTQKCVPLADSPLERLDCGLVIRSIGHRSVRIDPDLPFDEARGVIACTDAAGRCLSDPDGGLVYASGWSKLGAVGVILTTLADARITAEAILEDLCGSENRKPRNGGGFEAIRGTLQSRGVRPVSFEEWERVDAEEKSLGQALGKPREKFTSLKEILQVAFADVAKLRNGIRKG